MVNRRILALSLNHRVTPLSVREKVAFTKEDGVEFLRRVRSDTGAEEILLVSTCNRTELYTVGERELPEKALFRNLEAVRGFAATSRPRNYELYTGSAAVRHLFRVAGGLDSQILGESQILGQVKGAIEWAQAAETTGRVSHRLWERSLRAGKRIRTETAIGDGALSASYAALDLARKIFGSLENRSVLVIGAGEIATLALEHLKDIATGELTLMNRTRATADELAARFGGQARDFGELQEALAGADLVISSTASKEPLVSYEEMKKIRRERRGERPLLIVDLAVPRDFDETCGTLDEVFLKNLDDLTEITEANVEERRKEIPRAEAIIEAEVENFFRWLEALELEPAIRKLRETFHTIRGEELSLLDGQLEGESFSKVDRATERLVNRLLHALTSNLRRREQTEDGETAEVLRRLLGE